MNKFDYLSARETVAALANKKISAVELLDHTIQRIENLDKKINAVVVRDFERARVTAKIADEIIAKGIKLPLLGLPITVKESFNVIGLTTSWGNPLFKSNKSTHDALVIERLKAAGAIIIGKTNIPFMLGDWQSYNAIYGITNNPWDLTLTPGGSSGGSAAALAAGFVALELGSDLAGSLRVPAHFCGVYAHKPSQDLIPSRGSEPPMLSPTFYKTDLAVAGPMARTSADLALALHVLAGPDPLIDGMAYHLTLPLPRHKKLNEFRVLVLDTHPLCPTEASIKKSLHSLVSKLEKHGVQVTVNAPHPDLATITQNYATLLGAFGAANLPKNEYEKLHEINRKIPLDDDSLGAAWIRGNLINHRDWLLATRARAQLRIEWRKLFHDYDVIICPVISTTAFPHNHEQDFAKRRIKFDEHDVPYEDQFAWSSIATLFGLPATVVPIESAHADLPVGVQIIGDFLQDNTTLKFAELIENEFGGFVKPGVR